MSVVLVASDFLCVSDVVIRQVVSVGIRKKIRRNALIPRAIIVATAVTCGKNREIPITAQTLRPLSSRYKRN